MKYKVWYSTQELVTFLEKNTILNQYCFLEEKIYESDANNSSNFHKVPDKIKKILYLDSPDLILEYNGEPLFSLEISREAGTGHNVFQRFARLSASAENNVPSFYIYPEASIVVRNNKATWDKINPLIFQALESLMTIHEIPTLLFYYPSQFRTSPTASSNLPNKGLLNDNDPKCLACPDSSNSEMQNMFKIFNEIILLTEKKGIQEAKESLIKNLLIRDRRNFLCQEFVQKSKNKTLNTMSPLGATKLIKTEIIFLTVTDFV